MGGRPKAARVPVSESMFCSRCAARQPPCPLEIARCRAAALASSYPPCRWGGLHADRQRLGVDAAAASVAPSMRCRAESPRSSQDPCMGRRRRSRERRARLSPRNLGHPLGSQIRALAERRQRCLSGGRMRIEARAVVVVRVRVDDHHGPSYAVVAGWTLYVNRAETCRSSRGDAHLDGGGVRTNVLKVEPVWRTACDSKLNWFSRRFEPPPPSLGSAGPRADGEEGRCRSSGRPERPADRPLCEPLVARPGWSCTSSAHLTSPAAACTPDQPVARSRRSTAHGSRRRPCRGGDRASSQPRAGRPAA